MRGYKMSLKIDKTETNFMQELYIHRTYIIDLSNDGYEPELETEIATAAASFSRVLIKGVNNYEPLTQSKSIATLCKDIQKLNPYTQIVLYTNGMIKPVGLNTIKNIQYVVHVKLKETGIPYDERINEVSWKWLAKAEAQFVFTITDEEDYDEIGLIIAALLIKNQQVYINIKGNDYDKLAFMACNIGYNLFFQYEGDWFSKK